MYLSAKQCHFVRKKENLKGKSIKSNFIPGAEPNMLQISLSSVFIKNLHVTNLSEFCFM